MANVLDAPCGRQTGAALELPQYKTLPQHGRRTCSTLLGANDCIAHLTSHDNGNPFG